MAYWRKKLTKKELRHIRQSGATSFEDVRRNVLYQAQMRFPCWQCVEIGRKLGIDVELTAFNNSEK